MASSGQAEKNKTILMIQKWGGMLVLFLIIVAINVTGGIEGKDNVENYKPIYLFAIGSWLVLLIGTIIREQMQDKHDEDFMEFLPNALMTTLYFGFIVNAISVKARTGGGHSGGNKRGGSDGVGQTGLAFSKAIGKYFATTIYLAIFMVIINTIGNLYSFENCGDDENKYVKSLLNAQYNIIAISVLGAIAFVLVRSKEIKKSASKVSGMINKIR